MTVERLHNEDWGFESNCFVCEPRNSGGLQIPFHHDTDHQLVSADFSLDGTFSGAPNYVHGGVSLAILDEAQAWATIALAGKFALTTETKTRFLRPILVDRNYRVEAQITAQDAEQITTTAQIRFDKDGEQQICAESTASFAVLGAAQAVRAIGENAAIEAAYLKDETG